MKVKAKPLGKTPCFKNVHPGLTQRIQEYYEPMLASGFGAKESLQKAVEAVHKEVSDELAALPAAPISGDDRFAAAWHGTPHEVDQFSTEYIGTGEGAQAYGYGLYFAGNREVAEHYRKTLTSGMRSDSDMPKIKSYEGARDIALDFADFGKNNMLDRIEQGKYDYALNGPAEKNIIIDWIKNGGNKGRLYKVELAPAEDEYLLWDKPLSEQSEKVKAALKDIGGFTKSFHGRELDSYGGAGIYNMLSDAIKGGFFDKGLERRGITKTDPRAAASEYLHSLGIRGIKYLDGNSRSGKREDYNYVIFDDKDVTIEERFSRGEQNEFTTRVLEEARRADEGGLLTDASEYLRGVFSPEFYDRPTATARATKANERSALRKWATERGLMIDPAEFDSKWTQKLNAEGKPITGNEHDVVFNDDGTVTKRNRMPNNYHESYAEFFDRVAIFNYLFTPDAKLTFKGFQEVDGILMPVFDQKFMKGGPARIEETEAFLSEAFEPVGKKTSAYRLKGSDIIVTDVFGENTRKVGNQVVPMDYVIMHGKRANDYLEYQEKRGAEINEAIDLEGFDAAFDEATKFTKTTPVPPPNIPQFLKPTSVKEVADGYEITQPYAEPVAPADNKEIIKTISAAWDNGYAMEDYAYENFGKVDNKVYVIDADSLTPKAESVFDTKEELVKRATAALKREEGRFARDPFYSQTERLIRDAKQTKWGSVKELIGWMKGKTSQDEVAQLGIEQEFADKKGITKQEVLDAIAANTVELQDVVLGGTTEEAENHKRQISEIAAKMVDLRYEFQESGYFVKDFIRGGFNEEILAPEYAQMLADYRDYKDRLETEKQALFELPKYETHFSQYTEPGAVDGSYREMFVTAPKVQTKAVEWKQTDTDEWTTDYKDFAIYKMTESKYMLMNPANNRQYFPTLDAAKKDAEDQIGRYFDMKVAGKWQDGHGQYSEIQNPVVRIRFNDRMVDGKRILFVEEMQGPSGDQKFHIGGKVFDKKPDAVKYAKDNNLSEADIKKVVDGNQGKMPPYLQERIYDIGVKRVLAYAKENGYDGIAWTTGEMQAKRYDLSKEVDNIAYEKNPDGTLNVSVYGKRDLYNPVWDSERTTQQDLEGVVGKELAYKIATTATDEPVALSGLDLKVGGEGLKSLYDRTIPALFKKYGKEGVDQLIVATEESAANKLQNPAYQRLMAQMPDKSVPGTMRVPHIPITDKTPDAYARFARDPFTAPVADTYNSWMANLARFSQKALSWLQPLNRRYDYLATLNLPPELHNLILSMARESELQRDVQNSVLATTKEVVDKWMDAGKRNKDFDASMQLAHRASQMQLHPAKSAVEQGWGDNIEAVRSAWNKAIGVKAGTTFDVEFTKLQQEYHALSKETRQAYLGAVDKMSELRSQLADAYKNSILEMKVTPEKKAQLLKALELRMRNLKGAYMPLTRFGEYVATVYKKNSDGSRGEVLETLKRESIGELRSAVKVLQAKYPEADHIIREYDGRALIEAKANRISPALLEKMKELLIANNTEEGFKKLRKEAKLFLEAEAENLSDDQRELVKNLIQAGPRSQATALAALKADVMDKEELVQLVNTLDEVRTTSDPALTRTIDDLEQLFIETLPESSALKNSMHRKGVAGFDRDAIRGTLAYANKYGKTIAYLNHGRKIDRMETEADTMAKEIPNAEKSLLAQTLLKDTFENRKAVMDEKVGELGKLSTKLSFMWYLTSPSMLLVQNSQPWAITLPYLMSRYGVSKGISALWRNHITYQMGQKFTDSKINTFDADQSRAPKDWNENLPFSLSRYYEQSNSETRAKILKGLTDEQKDLLALKLAIDTNAIANSLTHEAMQYITEGEASPMKENTRKAMDMLAYFQRTGEMLSRKGSFMASFELARKSGKDFDASVQAAKDAVNDTLYDYSATNRPRLISGTFGRFFGAFRTYQLQTFGKLMNLGAAAAHGDKQALKELGYIMATNFVLAGTTGLPLAGTLVNFLGAMAFHLGFDDDDELDFITSIKEEMLKSTAGQVAMKGAPVLVGADLSHRIGMEGLIDVFKGEPPSKATPKDRMNFYASQILGPGYAAASGVMANFYQANLDGDWAKALRNSTPRPLSSVLNSFKLADKGLTDGSGRVVIPEDQISKWDVALMMVGVNPAEVAIARDKERNVKAVTDMIDIKKARLAKDLEVAVLNSDGDAQAKAQEAIAKFNQQYPQFGFTSQSLATRLRSAMKEELGVKTKSVLAAESYLGREEEDEEV